jgi:predicted site-specific integrase-resolvase
VPARKVGGLVLIGDPAAPAALPGQTVVYARVSSADQEADLDRQVARVTGWATGRHLPVDRVVTEVGSALNGHCPQFLALLRDPAVTVIAVEHRGRLAGYVEAALLAQGRRLLVADPSEAGDDLVRDATEILTSLCARLYGPRTAADRAARAVAALAQDSPG